MPEQSKLATVKITTPSLKKKSGLGVPREPAPRGEPGHNPFNALLALYLVAARPQPWGADQGRPGWCRPNEDGPVDDDVRSDRIAYPARRLPPLPFSRDVPIQPGRERAARDPARRAATSPSPRELTPWSNPGRPPLDPPIPPFAIFANCPPGGVPPFTRGDRGHGKHNAGAYSPLYIRITRQDGEQEITGFAPSSRPG